MSNITLIAADRTLFSLVHKLSMQLFPEIIVVRGILGEGGCRCKSDTARRRDPH